jgi:hypothetical protein
MLTFEKIKIGTSDYSRKEMESGDIGWAIGTSTNDYMETIELYEREGYTVSFETSLFRKLFGLGIYKVVARKLIE